MVGYQGTVIMMMDDLHFNSTTFRLRDVDPLFCFPLSHKKFRQIMCDSFRTNQDIMVYLDNNGQIEAMEMA